MAHGKRTNHPHKPSQSDPKQFDFGILVVHGVGNQKRGSTSALLARRLHKTLQELGIETSVSLQPEASAPASPSHASASQMSIDNTTDVLISEAHWADLIRDNRGTSARDVVRRLIYLLSILPYLIATTIVPRSHEPLSNDQFIAGHLSAASWSLFGQLRQAASWAPTMWRFLTLQGVIFVTWFSITRLPPAVTGSTLAVIAILGCSVLRGHWDIIEHVRSVSHRNPVEKEIQKRIADQLVIVSRQCRRVWVIGHSQGGYLAHAVLSQNSGRRWPNVVKFTGLASGLRPIHLINTVRGREWIISGWLLVLANAFLAIGLLAAFEPGGLFNSDGYREFMQFLVLSFTHPPILFGGAHMIDEAFQVALPSNWLSLALFIPGAACFIGGLHARRNVESAVEEIRGIPRSIDWEEISSPSDLVGSMSIPELPAAVRSRTLPSLRNPIGDHLLTSHFSSRSIFRLEITDWLTRADANKTANAHLPLLASHLSILSARTYRLRLTIQMSYFVLTILIPATWGASIYGSIQAALPLAILLAASTFAVSAVWWFVASGLSTRRFFRASRERGQLAYASASSRSEVTYVLMMLSVLLATLGGVGMTWYSQEIGGHGEPAEWPSLAIALGNGAAASSGITILAALAFSLASAGLRGVRLLLLIGLMSGARALSTLVSVGDPWDRAGGPGGLILFLTSLTLLAALLSAKRGRSPL